MTYDRVLPPDCFRPLLDRLAQVFVVVVDFVAQDWRRGEEVAQPSRLERINTELNDVKLVLFTAWTLGNLTPFVERRRV